MTTFVCQVQTDILINSIFLCSANNQWFLVVYSTYMITFVCQAASYCLCRYNVPRAVKDHVSHHRPKSAPRKKGRCNTCAHDPPVSVIVCIIFCFYLFSSWGNLPLQSYWSLFCDHGLHCCDELMWEQQQQHRWILGKLTCVILCRVVRWQVLRHRVSPCRSAYFASPWWLLTLAS